MQIERLRQIASEFDGFLLDQFGVIHDGQKLYPGVLEILAELHRAKRPVAVITNSGKRAEANRTRLVTMGIPREHFVDSISSGEVAYQVIGREPAFIIGRDGDDYGFDGVPLVRNPSDARVILILGSNAPATSLDGYRRLLVGLRIPAICCNPDKQMLTPRGLQPAPGAIASLYEEMGGTVTWIGKPFRSIYDHALKLIGNPVRVLCVGDSAEHDVAGARNAGLKVLLLKRGVSAGLDRFNPEPDYIADDFIW